MFVKYLPTLHLRGIKSKTKTKKNPKQNQKQTNPIAI